MEEENLIARLKNILQTLNITSSAFADKCGISRATLSQLMTGRNKKISSQLLSLIHEAYPEINVLWLMFGEGEMMNSDSDAEWHETSLESSNCNDDPELHRITAPFSISHTPENLINPSRETNSSINSKENRLKYDQEEIHRSEEQLLRAMEIESDLRSQIEILKKKIKKVNHITIYYDDNTFETFYPK